MSKFTRKFKNISVTIATDGTVSRFIASSENGRQRFSRQQYDEPAKAKTAAEAYIAHCKQRFERGDRLYMAFSYLEGMKERQYFLDI